MFQLYTVVVAIYVKLCKVFSRRSKFSTCLLSSQRSGTLGVFWLCSFHSSIKKQICHHILSPDLWIFAAPPELPLIMLLLGGPVLVDIHMLAFLQ